MPDLFARVLSALRAYPHGAKAGTIALVLGLPRADVTLALGRLALAERVRCRADTWHAC